MINHYFTRQLFEQGYPPKLVEYLGSATIIAEFRLHLETQAYWVKIIFGRSKGIINVICDDL